MTRRLPWIFVVAGGLMIAGGVWLLVSDAPRQDAARVAALPRVGPAELRTWRGGAEVLVEGRLATEAEPGPEGFVAYHREQYRDRESSGPDEGRERWTRIETVRAPIMIAADGVAVAVRNRDYRLEGWPHSAPITRSQGFGGLFSSTERFLGFKAGDRVTVDARVWRDTDLLRTAPQLEVTALYGGDATAYIASVRHGIVVFKIVGAVFVGCGLVLAAVGGFILKWARRRAPRVADEAAEADPEEDDAPRSRARSRR